MVCSPFLRSGWSVVRSVLLAKGDMWKKRPSLHLHKILTQSNRVHELCKRPLDKWFPICGHHMHIIWQYSQKEISVPRQGIRNSTLMVTLPIQSVQVICKV
jgi:hypothetical protein